jgi:hypothetical protein
MAQICWTNDVAHTILNRYEDSNDFCRAWLEITGYFDKAMTTKLKRIRLQGFFTTVRFHNVMHEWKGTWVGFIAHVIKQICQYQNLCKFESDKYSDTQLITFMDAIFNQTEGLSQVLIQNEQTHKAARKDPRISFKEFVEQLTERAKIYNAMDNIQERGAIDMLVSNKAQVKTSNHVKDVLRSMII